MIIFALRQCRVDAVPMKIEYPSIKQQQRYTVVPIYEVEWSRHKAVSDASSANHFPISFHHIFFFIYCFHSLYQVCVLAESLRLNPHQHYYYHPTPVTVRSFAASPSLPLAAWRSLRDSLSMSMNSARNRDLSGDRDDLEYRCSLHTPFRARDDASVLLFFVPASQHGITSRARHAESAKTNNVYQQHSSITIIYFSRSPLDGTIVRRGGRVPYVSTILNKGGLY